MNNDILTTVLIGILSVGWLLALVRVYSDEHKKERGNAAKFIVRTALFGAIASILYVAPFLSIPVPFLPPFLKFHFDEIAVFIAGFAYGPWCAVGAILIKTLVKLPFTDTLAVGELSDLIYSVVFIVPASIIYRKHRTFGAAMLGMVLGTALQLVVSLLLNIYAMIPFYMFVMGFSRETLLAIMQGANASIKDLEWGYGLLAVLPFNVLKDALVIFITIIVYKATHRLIDRF